MHRDGHFMTALGVSRDKHCTLLLSMNRGVTHSRRLVVSKRAIVGVGGL